MLSFSGNKNGCGVTAHTLNVRRTSTIRRKGKVCFVCRVQVLPVFHLRYVENCQWWGDGKAILQVASLSIQWVSLSPQSGDVDGEEKKWSRPRCPQLHLNIPLKSRIHRTITALLADKTQIVPLEPLEWSLLQLTHTASSGWLQPTSFRVCSLQKRLSNYSLMCINHVW